MMKSLFGQSCSRLLITLSILAAGAANAAVITSFDNRSELKATILEQGLEQHRQGFNRVKGKRRGGQRSFAWMPLELNGFEMAMRAGEGVRVPKGKRNRVTKRKKFRLNRTKYAWVKTRTGVDLELTFDNPIYAFGAKFRGLNNRRASTSVFLDKAEAGELAKIDPPKTRGRQRTFFGFASDEAFSTITFSGIDAFGMDKLIWGDVPMLPPSVFVAPSAAVSGLALQPTQLTAAAPVAPTFILMLIGAMGLVVTRLQVRG